MIWPEILGLCLAMAAGAYGLAWLVAPWVVRTGWKLAVWTRYRLMIAGEENVPRSGPALMLSNHVTWVDGFLLTAACPRHAWFLVNADYISLPLVRQLAWRCRMIPVPYRGPRAMRAAIEAARAALSRGELLAIFPEGQLTRNGLTGPFRRGLEAILNGMDGVPVVPAYMDNLWGSSLSFDGGGFLNHWPSGLRHTVPIAFGPPLASPITAFQARQAVLEASVRAYAMRPPEDKIPLDSINPALPRLEDSTLGPLTGSTDNYDVGGVQQTGQKPGTAGVPLPGVALRIVDPSGAELGPDRSGRVQALIAGSEV
ncbi:MAG: 1-acyl-sn-glycerol-3-phosphate acyltransferase [Isosphaeraceae bacterium]